MSNRYIEKSFLYLVALSVLLHLAIFQLVRMIPEGKPKPPEQPTMVDLTDLPLPKMEQPHTKGDEISPRETVRDQRPATPPPVAQRPVPPKPQAMRPSPPRPAVKPSPSPSPLRQQPQPSPAAKSETAQIPRTPPPPAVRGEGIFKPKSSDSSVPKGSPLFPSPTRLARLEETYRRKYANEIDDETRFLNSDDIRFGSFLRRLETAVYGVWRYPREALERGIEGTTPVRITFNRSGEVVQVDILESSGSKILDNEVLRTLKEIGPIGSFPRGYTSDTFKVIAFFHYGNGGGRLH
ncbi:TonB-dependent receptor [Geomonas sp. Red276]